MAAIEAYESGCPRRCRAKSAVSRPHLFAPVQAAGADAPDAHGRIDVPLRGESVG